MKYLIIFLSGFISINTTAQKIAKVEITTTASTSEALEAFKTAGKLTKYASKDFDEAGKVTLWQYYVGGNDRELQIRITSEMKDGSTVWVLRMPHLPNTMGSYIKELKKFVNKLSLPNMKVSEYFDGIE